MAEEDSCDDVCDSWEEMIENGILEKKLEELKVKVDNSHQENIEWDGMLPIPQVKLEETTRTQYVPQVKILKRPNDTKSGSTGNEKSPSKHPVKTLQQREAEYAEARLRILGASCSRDEEKEKINRLTLISSDNSELNVTIRQPHGPDGTKGFIQRR
ncbi:SUZ domain-containing protein 1-like [Centruroides sculpturatus]|uniref:SUZ domain-containing protein 1-like n=1 Tax=Centruroides sculpturatus TaxID=218467 RepID=UPI000C6DF282|nr:SUZ domain-containing protein 1-like [Centruroides sculpturatus]